MGGFAGLHLAMQHPGRVRSLVAGTGYGARPGEVERFRGECDAIAEVIETSGIGAFARQYMSGPSRVQLQNKDPRAWQEYTEWLSEHSAKGSAATMRGVQRGRPSLYALEAELAAIATPVLVLAGDEDDGCLETSVWLKRVIPTAGLAVLAKSGHTLNIEEPDLVNTLIADFLSRVTAGVWGPRDERADPGHHRLLVSAGGRWLPPPHACSASPSRRRAARTWPDGPLPTRTLAEALPAHFRRACKRRASRSDPPSQPHQGQDAVEHSQEQRVVAHGPASGFVSVRSSTALMAVTCSLRGNRWGPA